MIPQPRSIKKKEGYFTVSPQTRIIIKPNREQIIAAKDLKESFSKILGFKPVADGYGSSQAIEFSFNKDIQNKEGYVLCITQDKINLEASTETGIFYGVQTLKQLIATYKRRIPCMEIEDEPSCKNRGFYHDVTRGKVPTLATLKELADLASSYKLNQLQLYVEHTFAFKGQSEVWSCTDPLSAEEILEFDEYCHQRHIELIPSFSTFGHLYEAMRSESYSHLCELTDSKAHDYSWADRMAHHTLDVSQEESIIFVKNMIDQVVPLFRSNIFNICADETFDLGKGKNKEKCYNVGTSKLYVEFLNKIIELVKAHDKEVMFWGDIIIKHPEHIGDLPKDLICLNWWYWGNYPEEKVEIIKDQGFRQYLCPGVNGWNKMMNDHQMAYDNVVLMTKHGERFGAEGILNTDWGDYGHLNLFANSLPGLIYGANFSWNSAERTFDNLNEVIDVCEYGLNHNGPVSLIAEVGKLHYLDFTPLVKWIEKGETDKLEKINATELEMREAVLRLKEIEETLIDHLGLVHEEKRQDIRELIVATKGVSIFNKLLPVMRMDLLNTETEYIIQPNDLAIEIEYWLEDYKRVWRERNKESELYRIIAFFKNLCKYLREIE